MSEEQEKFRARVLSNKLTRKYLDLEKRFVLKDCKKDEPVVIMHALNEATANMVGNRVITSLATLQKEGHQRYIDEFRRSINAVIDESAAKYYKEFESGVNDILNRDEQKTSNTTL